MENKKYVSVIIPIYNAEPYLKECLSSVCKQTYPFYEAILIDDGSSDSSFSIASSFAGQNNRFRLFHVDNGGVSKARNLGISLAKYDYICFIDADDFIEPSFLEHLMKEIKDADVCVCAKRRWDQIKNRSRCDRFPFFYGTVRSLCGRLFPYRKAMRGITGRIFRTALFQNKSLLFDESLSYGEDMQLNYAAFCLSEKAVFSPVPLYTYRIHNPFSLSRISRVKVSAQSRAQRQCIRMLKASVKNRL